MKKTLIAGLAGLSLAFAALPALAEGKKSVDATRSPSWRRIPPARRSWIRNCRA
jgi:hypothetical protein